MPTMRKVIYCLFFLFMVVTISYANMEFTNKLFEIEIDDKIYSIVFYGSIFSGGMTGTAVLCVDNDDCVPYLYEEEDLFIKVPGLTNFYYADPKLILINHDYYELIEAPSTTR